MDKHKKPSYPLRLPADLREQLDAHAQANERSLNGEIVARLKESLQREKGKKK